MLGKPLDTEIYPIYIHKYPNNYYQWSMADNSKFLGSRVYPGILLHDNGPQITTVDSRYLKYKVAYSPGTKNVQPEVNMIVNILIIYGQDTYKKLDYVVESLSENKMTLKLIDKNYYDEEEKEYLYEDILHAEKHYDDKYFEDIKFVRRYIKEDPNGIHDWTIIDDDRYHIINFGQF